MDQKKVAAIAATLGIAGGVAGGRAFDELTFSAKDETIRLAIDTLHESTNLTRNLGVLREIERNPGFATSLRTEGQPIPTEQSVADDFVKLRGSVLELDTRVQTLYGGTRNRCIEVSNKPRE